MVVNPYTTEYGGLEKVTFASMLPELNLGDFSKEVKA